MVSGNRQQNHNFNMLFFFHPSKTLFIVHKQLKPIVFPYDNKAINQQLNKVRQLNGKEFLKLSKK